MKKQRKISDDFRKAANAVLKIIKSNDYLVDYHLHRNELGEIWNTLDGAAVSYRIEEDIQLASEENTLTNIKGEEPEFVFTVKEQE